MVVQMELKDIHVGGKLIDSYYRGKKFSTHETFTKVTSNKDTIFVKKDLVIINVDFLTWTMLEFYKLY